MALEGMRDEMIRRLQEHSATAGQIAEYEARWKQAMNQTGTSIPCPLCFMGGDIHRVKSISDEGGIGIAVCEHCHERFEYSAPEGK